MEQLDGVPDVEAVQFAPMSLCMAAVKGISEKLFWGLLKRAFSVLLIKSTKMPASLHQVVIETNSHKILLTMNLIMTKK